MMILLVWLGVSVTWISAHSSVINYYGIIQTQLFHAEDNVFNDIETVLVWNNDDISLAVNDVCNSLFGGENLQSSCHFQIASHIEQTTVEHGDHNQINSYVKSLLHGHNNKLQVSRAHVAIVAQVIAEELLRNGSAGLVIVDGCETRLNYNVDLNSTFADLINVFSFDSYLNSSLNMSSKILLLNYACNYHAEIPLPQLDEVADMLIQSPRPTKIILIGYSESDSMHGILSSIYDLQSVIPGHISATATVSVFDSARTEEDSRNALKAFFDQYEPADTSYDSQSCSSTSLDASLASVSKSLLQRGIIYHLPVSCAGVNDNNCNPKSCVYLGRTSYGNHFPHWALIMSYAWSLHRWHRNLGLPPIVAILDRSGSGSGAGWMKSFRRHLKRIWNVQFLHDFSALNVDVLRRNNPNTCLLESRLTGDDSWTSVDKWFLDLSDGHALQSMLMHQHPCSNTSTLNRVGEINYLRVENILTHSSHEEFDCIDAESCDVFVAQSLRALAGNSSVVVVNRRGSRGFANIEDIFPIIGSQFEPSYLEDITFEEQMALFHSAELMIIGHGAALTNIMFMKACAIVIEFMPWGYYIPGMFGGLASDMRLIYKAVEALAPSADLLRVCPAAINRDCRVGEANMTVESFRCRSCVRMHGQIRVDGIQVRNVIREAVIQRAQCLLNYVGLFVTD